VNSARIKGNWARQCLGWNPTFAEEAFEQEIKDVFIALSKTKDT
jgi:hypothetical protein